MAETESVHLLLVDDDPASVRAARLRKIGQLCLDAQEIAGFSPWRTGEREGMEIRLAWGIRLMWLAFQPVVGWRSRRVVGYETLVRSDQPLLRRPADILGAAERLGRVQEVGRAVRARVATAAECLTPASAKIFLNLHPDDLNDDDLYDKQAPLSKLASRVVLELTARASLRRVHDVAGSIARLKSLGFRFAVDDIGVTVTGYEAFTRLQPDFAKLDTSLVRGVNADSRRQSIIRSMKGVCDSLDVVLVAEGVKTAAERRTLVALGCDLLQGDLFGKPGRGFGAARF